jgi:mRNA-degrading endonuclease RelE of RelBE toxin-antitoxin system
LSAASFYDGRASGLGSRFLDEVARSIALIKQYPDTYPVAFGDDVRRIRLHRFPYRLVYRRRTDNLVIYAVAHAKHRATYWQRRIDQN